MTEHTPTVETPAAEAPADPAWVTPDPAAVEPAAGAGSDERPSLEGVLGSHTGWDEIAIKGAFGAPLSDMDASTMMRAGWFTLMRRAGTSDVDAYRTAMCAPFREVADQFADSAQAMDAGKA